MKKSEAFTRIIRCPVEIANLSKIRAGVARIVEAEGIQVEFALADGEDLRPGSIVELVSAEAPVGPLQAKVQIVSVGSRKDDGGHPIVSTSLAFVNLTNAQEQELRGRIQAMRPLVVTIGLDVNLNQTDAFRVVPVSRPQDLYKLVEEENIAVLILGPQLAPSEAHEILAHTNDKREGPAVNILVGVGTAADAFQDYIDGDRIFYLARGIPEKRDLQSLIIAATGYRPAVGDNLTTYIPPEATDQVLDFCVRMGVQQEATDAAALLVDAVKAVSNTLHSEYLMFDRTRDILISRDRNTNDERTESAAAGIVGYVIRTGERVMVDNAASDFRYDPGADNPTGLDLGPFLCQPILGIRGEVLGVITALRKIDSHFFSAEDVKRIEVLVSYAGLVISTMLLQAQASATFIERSEVTGNSELYREEALEAYSKHPGEEGHLLGASPRWLTVAHWIAIFLFIVIITFISVAHADEYADGPALIRAKSKFVVTAPRSGLVDVIEVGVGSRVRRGDLLIRLHDVAIGATTAERLNQQVWAAGDGVVSDVRVRAGQQVNQGEQLASVIDETAGYEVVALMPGQYAPQMHPGMQVVLKLDGYSGSHETMRIDHVGTEIVGPDEALRDVGTTAATLTVAGPVVRVGIQVHGPRFAVDDRSYEYHDGMIGRAEVIIRSRPIIVTLVPGLKEMFSK